jgi:hypothetical protein
MSQKETSSAGGMVSVKQAAQKAVKACRRALLRRLSAPGESSGRRRQPEPRAATSAERRRRPEKRSLSARPDRVVGT